MTMQPSPNRLRKSLAVIALLAMASAGAPAMAAPGACVIAKIAVAQASKLNKAASGICASEADVDACMQPSRDAYDMAFERQALACP